MAADVDIAELPLESVGQQLRRAREAAGKTIADIATATKIPERLLIAIEESRFSAMPSRVYAIGFSRSYARQLGLDEAAIVNEVRIEMDGAAPLSTVDSAQAFAPGDPARVPGKRLAYAAGFGALLTVAAVVFFWFGGWNTSGSLPSILPADAPIAQAPAPARAPASHSAAISAPALPAGGTVSLSALSPGIWVKVYEASGKTLYEGQMALGQSFTVPADAQAPLLWTGRPDALAITIAGKPAPKLSETQKTMKNVPISAAALVARNVPPAGVSAPGAAMASTASE